MILMLHSRSGAGDNLCSASCDNGRKVKSERLSHTLRHQNQGSAKCCLPHLRLALRLRSLTSLTCTPTTTRSNKRPQSATNRLRYQPNLTITTTSNMMPASSNTTISTPMAPSVNTSVVHMTTGVASQVFNTPELLDLILSKLEAKDVLLRASLVCRAFKTSIDSSPTINENLEFALIDAVFVAVINMGRIYHYSRGLLLYSNLARPPMFFLALDFHELPIKRYLSSPSFRKLRMLGTSSQCDFSSVSELSVYEPAERGFRIKKFVSPDKREEKVTIVELLEKAIARLEIDATLIRLLVDGKGVET
jgi:hypothetical protein